MNLKTRLYTLQLKVRQWLIAKSQRSATIFNESIEPSDHQPTKMLFVLAGLIGDSVMSLPVITEARRFWPRARIAVLGKKHNRELIAACSFYDEFYEFNADPFSLRKSGETKKLEAWLSEQDFDAAFILLGDQFAHLLARAGIPVRVGVTGTPLENCLTHTYEIGSPRSWGPDERLNALRCLGYQPEAVSPSLAVNEDVRRSGRAKLLALGLDESMDYAVLHPFGSSRRQWWKFDEIGNLATKLKAGQSLQAVLVGAGEAADIQEAKNPDIISTLGQLTLPELLAVIDEARLVITTDSGPFHIAGALRKPIVGLFRDRRPEHAGRYSKTEIVFGEDPECAKSCDWERCADDPCRQMMNISVEAVAGAADRIPSKA
jgi:ADP-heptose:LPS heptosyltransferase